MSNRLSRILQLAALTALLAGCGSNDSPVGSGQTPASLPPTVVSNNDIQTRLNAALVADPNTGTRIAHSRHLNPLRSGIQAKAGPVGTQTAPAMNITVADLESDYETLFGSLNSSLGVTLTTPQVVSDIDFIASQPGTGFFNLNSKPIQNNPLGVTGVSFQPVLYSTTVPLPGGSRTFNVSGGLILPLGINKSQVKGVLVYFHGTTFSKASVPSSYTEEAQLMAQVFGSQGYIVVMPDYVGQGVDFATVHPYVLYPTVSAQTAADMLTAVKPTITRQYGLTSTDPSLKLFSAGYSEGGAYSLWFNQYLSANPSQLDPLYRLTHSVGMEGAYSTSNVTFGYLFQNVTAASPNTFNVQNQQLVDVVKPILSADAFLSYATYTVNSDFNSVFNPPYFALNATFPVLQLECDVNSQHLDIQQAFALQNTTIATQMLFAGMGKTSNNSTYPGQLEIVAGSTSNSVNALVSPTLFTSGPFAQLMSTLRAADVDLGAVANQGVSIITLDQDSVVVPNNFQLLQQTYGSKIKSAITVPHKSLLVLSPFSTTLGQAVWVPTDHLHGLIYEFLYALNIFNGF